MMRHILVLFALAICQNFFVEVMTLESGPRYVNVLLLSIVAKLIGCVDYGLLKGYLSN